MYIYLISPTTQQEKAVSTQTHFFYLIQTMASLVSDSAAKLGQFYAVCIGVDNCTNNATLVSGAFINELNYSPNNVHILNEGDGPTADEVLDTFINVLIPKINEKDTLIVYYSGQSCRVSEQFKFCTKGTYLSHKDFITKCINKVKTQRVVIVIDVCYSGDFNTFKSKDKPGRVVDAGDITAFLKPSGKICFFASQAKEIAPGSSAFTHAFVKSIEKIVRDNEEGLLSVSPLETFAKLTKIMKNDKDNPPLPRLCGVDEYTDFDIGPIAVDDEYTYGYTHGVGRRIP